MRCKRLLSLTLAAAMLFGSAALLPEGTFSEKSTNITAYADAENGLVRLDNSGTDMPYKNVADFDGLSAKDAKLFFYNQLDDFEKGIYDKIKNAGKNEVTFNIDKSKYLSVSRAVNALKEDNPRYKMYLSSFFDKNDEGDGTETITTKRNPYTNDYLLNKAEATIKQTVKTVKSNDTYTTLRKFWQYYVTTKDYDWDYMLTENRAMTYNDNGIGVFVYNTSVCGGFSSACKIICDELDIPCVIASNGGHGWNFVELDDGKWYAIEFSYLLYDDFHDLTGYNFLTGYNSEPFRSNEDYFITDLYIDHWSPFYFKFPAISADRYEYTGSNTDFSCIEAERNFVEPEPTFVYKVNEDGKSCTITDFYGKQEGDLRIPRKIDGYTVTRIGNEAFYRCNGFDGKLIIPDGVKEIDKAAFYSCRNLTELSIADSVKVIGDKAFIGCDKLQGKLRLPANLEVLGDKSFNYCKGFTGDIIIPDSVKELNGAFAYCDGFNGTLYLPDGLEWDSQLIAGTNIQTISVNESNKLYSVYDGVLYSKDKTKVLFCPKSKTGTISFPDELTEVEAFAFYQCEKLRGDIILPSGVKRIGEFAFADSGFDGRLILNNGLKYIGRNAFRLVQNLNGELIIPDSVISIGDGAFQCLGKVSGRLKLSENVSEYGEMVFDCTFRSTHINEIRIPDKTVKIGSYAFYEVSVENVYLNNAVEIDNSAFSPKWEHYEYENGGIKNYYSGSILFHCKCNNKKSIEWCKKNKCRYVIDEHVYTDSPGEPTSDGEKQIIHTCTSCGYSYTETIHNYGKWKTTKKPTYAEKGEKKRICTICGKTEYGEIDAIAHSHNYVVTIVKPTCVEGYTMHKCSLCGFYYKNDFTPAPQIIEHEPGEWVIIKQPTCVENGEKERICKNCGSRVNFDYIPCVPCSYGDWKVSKKATCTADGEQTRTCSVCKKTETKTLSKLGHNYVDTVVAPTCKAQGYTLHKCSRCGDSYKDTYTAKTAHTWSAWKTTGFDFAKKTSTQSRKCTACGKTATRTNKNAITRLAGANRFDSAAVISKAMYKTSNTVVIATGLTHQDALVAVPLASAYNVPLLLATEKHITAQTEAELKRLKAKNVIVVSTNGAIGAKAKAEFKAAKYNMTYIEGKTCFETAAKVAKALQDKTKKAPTTIFFATDSAFADALSASPVAAIKGAPIIYLNNKSIDKTVAEYLKSVKGKIKNAYIIGGDGVISNAMMKNVAKALGLTSGKTVQRVAGKNRYETCVAVKKKFKSMLTGTGICVAKGLDFPDALAGGVYAAATKQALFLADGKKLQDCQNTYLKGKNAGKITVFGGTGAVSDELVKLIAKASV